MKKFIKRCCNCVSNEMVVQLTPVELQYESLLMKHTFKLRRQQFILILVYLLVVFLTAIFASEHEDSAELEKKRLQAMVVGSISPLMIIILIYWIHLPLVQHMITLACFGPFVVWLEYIMELLVAISKQPAGTIKGVLPRACIYLMVSFHYIALVQINQSFHLQGLITGFFFVYLLARFVWLEQNFKSVYIRMIITILLSVFLNFICK